MNASRISLSYIGISWFYLLASTVIILAPFIFARHANATDVCNLKAAQVESVQGIVELRRYQSTTWESALKDTPLCAGDTLRVRKHSRAAIRLNNDSVMRLAQRTTITIPRTEDNKITSLTELIEGIIHIITRTPVPFKIKTPFINAGVEGTEFTVELASDHARIVMFEGRVTASNEYGNVLLTDHETAIAYSNQAPFKETIVKPLDAVQWALYYPAILGYHRNQQSAEASSLLLQAENLLSVGQADEARIIIKRLLKENPDNSEAIALKSIIAVVQNDKQRALELASHAVELDDLSVPARLALSYAQQAAFDIDEALNSIKQAVILDPQNALIWARLSELYMSVGELEQALEAAQEAVNLNPTIAKTQTVLGFAHLLQINTKEAKSIFHEAILLDQTDPMPRLGLGLALIREGQLEAGRIELEIAAILDPGNSLIRSYLGKAYFEEKRYSLAETQFELAKEHDPLDPTPWFYDAIQKQTQNRPVEALQDIQKSIERNDNRAVYRSRLLLDQDQAGRSSSLARIYDNLGFEKRAIMETAKSLAIDPSNHSAHRFLSDTYANIPRHEAARVSELLQAQLMQPINVNPVQPHLAVADLNIITNTGPSGAGFNEFAPLMERNRSQFVASGFGGNNSTYGNEIVFSKLYERTSISLGQFHYQTEGFRTNNDQNHDILNAFIQHAVTPKFNVQAEVRARSSDQGNIELDFDQDSNDPKAPQNRIRRKTDEDMARVGARYTLTPNQNILIASQFSDKKIQHIQPHIDPFIRRSSNLLTFTEDEGYQTEIQYQFQASLLNITAGSGFYHINRTENRKTANLENEPLEPYLLPNDFIRTKKNGYIYSNLNFNPRLTVSVGFSYDSFKDRGLTIDKFNPKLGLQWNLTNALRLRLAWIENIKTPLVTNQTIEPTQVAGFSQIFDDPSGTKSSRIGIGIDTNIGKKTFGGIELSSRNLKVPIHNLDSISFSFEDQKEKLYRTYLFSTIHQNWIVKGEIQFEQFSRAEVGTAPHKIDALSVPIGINYFSSKGFFSNLTGTFVHQKIDRMRPESDNEGTENFFLLDAALGYRLPNRRGILSIEAKNILDEAFAFRNINFFTSEPMNPRFVPTRTIFARLTLNF